MKVCIFGAGTVGGHLAVQLISANPEGVSLVSRGANLAAIRKGGLTLRKGGKDTHVRPPVVTDDPSSLPAQDLVLVTLKAHTLPAAAGAIARLLAPHGCAVFLLNGIPWWWRHGLPGATGTLPLLDPDGALWREVRPERALGCVVHSPHQIAQPGLIVHSGLDHHILGEPDNTASERLERVVTYLKERGVDARSTTDLRFDILHKLVNNTSGNPIAALARADLGLQGTDPGLLSLSLTLMRETVAVATAMGWDIASKLDLEKLARRGKPGDMPSMGADAVAGRSMEVEAIVGQLQAFAREKSVPVPAVDVILPLMRGLDHVIRASSR